MVNPRSWWLIAAVFVVVGAVALGAFGRSVIAHRYDDVDLKGLAEYGSRLPAHEGAIWDSTIERFQGAPGVTRSRDDLCPGYRCSESWILVAEDQDPEDHSAFAQVRFYAEQKPSSSHAVWEILSGPPRGWKPYESIEHRVEDPNVSEYASQVRLTCYSYTLDLDENVNCIWLYHARYAQYIVAIKYGSDTRPITRDEFLNEYVTPFDGLLVELLGLDVAEGIRLGAE